MSSATQNHPRMCGEKPITGKKVVKEMGSPPHVRGKEQAVDGLDAPYADHPRMCREKYFHSLHIALLQGSPPHVRGKDSSVLMGWLGGGITPACAGKRFLCLLNVFFGWDHPRMCGEKSDSRYGSWKA